jgi:hypothetical protein
METGGKFYLGKIFEPQTGRVSDEPLLYDPADLVTHAVVVGMTGSGKTGLCIDLLEEAALNGIPAFLIDPKGDITNHLLHFPSLLPPDFQPWINPDQARRDGLTVEDAARQAANTWRAGLAQWGLGPERILALKNSAGFAIFTPGSSSGVPVSILASFQAPQIAWEPNRELLREKISGTVTALLGLVGLKEIDPVRSREHILLANIFEHAWSQGRDMDLGELILQTQTPPFARLGVFDVNTFFPEKDRFELAMLLNNILAAPAFQSWLEGDTLDVQALLHLPDGRPRHNIFYIAHLTDAERMFFVTLLYSAIETWMRAQSGSPALRAIVYFDEIFGYLPPISNPPSKQPMLRMLKQARAFGVGQVLVTQNPVDMDYKALSNAGTWFIGKLQTEQDKARLLDGLASAAAGALDRDAYDCMISALTKRVFLLHNVHGRHPVIFQSRWAMNYLAGPLTRAQIPALNQLAGHIGTTLAEKPSAAFPDAGLAAVEPGKQASVVAVSRAMPPQPLDQFQAIPLEGSEPPAKEKRESFPTWDSSPAIGSLTRPTLPVGLAEYFLPNNLTFTQAFKAAGMEYPPEAFTRGILYRPAILAQALIRFVERKYDVDHESSLTVLVSQPDRRGVIRWEDSLREALDIQELDQEPVPQAQFAPLEAPLSDGRLLKSLQSDFHDWAYRTARLRVRAHEALGIYTGPSISQAEFRKMCAQAARVGRDEEIAKIEKSYEQKFQALGVRLEREERELDTDESELGQRRMEELGTHAENVLSLFSKSKRRISTSLTKRRLTEQARAEVNESRKAIRSLEKQIEALEAEMQQVLREVRERWAALALQDTEISLSPLKRNVFIDLFGVAWVPLHLVQMGEESIELPGFASTTLG